jgi:hypothetical protein
VDVFDRPNSRLYCWLRERLVRRQVKGIFLWTYVGCDLWRAEVQTLRETFQLPVCELEADGTSGCAPSHAGRIQAFLELFK